MSEMHRNRMSGGRKLTARPFFQLAAALLLNGYFAGFRDRKIFTGNAKALCVPVLNCYSCPGAFGSCPIGALQAVLNRRRFPFYVLGTLLLFGVLFGRLVCGFLCPFGFLQDLLNRIPHPERKGTSPFLQKADRAGRYAKYLILAGLVCALPAWTAFRTGMPVPYFCKFLCPAGTLEGGVPQMLLHPELRGLAGALFQWKAGILILILIAAVFVPRFFCRYLCPLGAFYALLNRYSFYAMRVDKARCVECGKCLRVCPMQVDVLKNINSGECIRCGRCRESCPEDAIRAGFRI